MVCSQIFATGESSSSEFWPKDILLLQNPVYPAWWDAYPFLHKTLPFLGLGWSPALCTISFCHGFYLNSGKRVTVLFYTHSSTQFMKPNLLYLNEVYISFAEGQFCQDLNDCLNDCHVFRWHWMSKTHNQRVQNALSKYYQLNIQL